jgi:nitronate monooxygenase
MNSQALGQLSDLGLRIPVLAAPMAGGPSTPELVVAAARAGSIGFLATGYQTPDAMSQQIAAVRSAGVPFAANVFVANPLAIEAGVFNRYAQAIQADADRYGLNLVGEGPIEDDDWWHEKVDLLLQTPVALVSFTFGIPERQIIEALHTAGSLVMQTVTSAAEARLAAQAGVDALAVQGSCAGGHSGTFTPQQPLPEIPLIDLVARVRRVVSLPLIAAGGLSTSEEISAVLTSGADAAMVGTALLRAEESGASAVHKAALADPLREATVITRAFTGRPARALRNRFIDRHDAQAPFGYPAVHHLTNPLRKAATAAGDPEHVHLWAGTGYRHATEEPVADILGRLARNL